MESITTMTIAAYGAMTVALVLCGIALLAHVGSPKPVFVRVSGTDRGFGSRTRGGDRPATDVLRSCETPWTSSR